MSPGLEPKKGQHLSHVGDIGAQRAGLRSWVPDGSARVTLEAQGGRVSIAKLCEPAKASGFRSGTVEGAALPGPPIP